MEKHAHRAIRKSGHSKAGAELPAAPAGRTQSAAPPQKRAAAPRKPKPKSSARLAATRARLERAALDAFAAKGVDAATTRDIAAFAGLSEGALYRHFASKEEIARALFDSIHDRLARLVRAAGAASATLSRQADAVVDAYCQTADEDWTLFSYHLLSTARFLPTPKGQDNPVAAAEDMIAAAVRRGELDPCDEKLVAAMALGIVLQPALHKAHGRIKGPLLAAAPELKRGVAALLSAYRSKR